MGIYLVPGTDLDTEDIAVNKTGAYEEPFSVSFKESLGTRRERG